MSDGLLHHVKKTIERYHLLDQEDRLIVGVSAGVDSMVLLHLLNVYRLSFNLRIIVAHVNHCLRPEESEREADLVQQTSERLGFPFEYGRFDVKAYQKARGLSLQDAARRIRFRFLYELLEKHGAQKLVLGQNADDQVETVLLRLLRGAGVKGLKGMLPIREGQVIRPLLETWREEIEAFAKDQAVPFLVDSSNMREDYLRNRLRLKLIPEIEKSYQSNFKKVILRTSAILKEEDGCLEQIAADAFARVVHEDQKVLFFHYADFYALHPAIRWRLIRNILRRVNPGEMSLEYGEQPPLTFAYETLNRAPASFSLELPEGWLLEKRYDLVSFSRGKKTSISPFEVELQVSGQTFIPGLGKKVTTEISDLNQKDTRLNGPPDVAFLDSEELQFPLRMRSFRPGDRFQPLGTRGTQRLKEFFIDHKIPRFERRGIPLLISRDQIAWVVGHRIAEWAKVTEKTRRVAKVEVSEEPE